MSGQTIYLYADADPVNRTDPSGNFSLGETMSAINTMSTLSNIATSSYDFVFGGPSESESDDQPGLWDALITSWIGGGSGLANWMEDNQGAGALGAAAMFGAVSPSGTEAHHTIPVYLCGKDSQTKVPISKADHIAIHSALDKVPFVFNLAGATVNLILSRWKAKKNLPTLSQYLKKKANRAVLIGALGAFYEAGGYRGRYPNFAPVFVTESALFVASKAHTSLPLCKK